MRRKEELGILIGTLKKEEEQKHNERLEKKKELRTLLTTFFIQFFEGLGIDLKGVKIEANIDSHYAKIYVTVGKNHSSDITLYYRNREGEFDLSYYSTVVNQNDKRNLTYLILVGAIANNIKSKGKVIPFVKKKMKVVSEIEEGKYDLEWKIQTLESELHDIKRKEEMDAIIDGGSLELKDVSYIKPTFKSRKGYMVKKLEIDKVNDNSITLLITERDGWKENDEPLFRTITKKFPRYDGECFLRRIKEVMLEQEKEELEETE